MTQEQVRQAAATKLRKTVHELITGDKKRLQLKINGIQNDPKKLKPFKEILEWMKTDGDTLAAAVLDFLNDSKTGKKLPLTVTHPELAAQWHPTRNGK